MIISVYNTAGGSSKTTTVLTILSALAQFNSVYPDQMLKVLAVDVDAEQGTLVKFSQARELYERLAHNITFVAVDKDQLSPECFAELTDGYDMVIIDMPGFYHEGMMKIAIMSDAVLVPCKLGVFEFSEANDTLNSMTGLREKYGILGFQALLVTRVQHAMNMIPKFSKIIFREMLDSGHAIINAKLTSIYAYQLQVDYGAYLFELEDGGGKSVYKALAEANALLQAITNFSVVEDKNGSDYQKVLISLGKPRKKEADTAKNSDA